MSEQVTIHFHSGTKAVATITADDCAEESDRLDGLSNRPFDIEDAADLIETVLTIPPKPRWCYIGDVFAFTQAICGVELGDTSGSN